jgi:TRAP-type C4-dicarboxylate transport system permease small subunit
MRLRTKVAAIFDDIINLLAIVAAVALIVIMLLVGADVTMRYFLNHPIGHVLEITEHLLLVLTFSGSAWVLKREGHVKSDILLNRLNPSNQALINTITSIIGAITCLVLAWYGAQVAWDSFLRGIFFATLMRLPQAPFMAIISAGCFLLFIQFLRRSYGCMKNWKALQRREQKSSRSI